MGCSASSPAGDPEVLRRNKEINAAMEQQARADGSKIKLLLLGAGESGKSTLFKQMKVIYGKDYSEEEKRHHIHIIYGNVIQSMKVLLTQAEYMGTINEIGNIKAIELIKGLDEHTGSVDADVGNAVASLWSDPAIQKVWLKRNEFQVLESAAYYFNKIDQIQKPDFLPDKDDILHSRVRTSGIVTENYVIDGSNFEMYDVGGQRNERKKWIHCFENVTAIIFVAAISEYDQRLFEDASANRMVEALTLFDDICNNAYFKKSSIILFLNKKDLFADKIQRSPIKSVPQFEDYKGKDGDFDDGVKYFLEKFREKNRSPDHEIYSHVTCATDTRNVRVVFDSCKDIILKQNLRNSGLLD